MDHTGIDLLAFNPKTEKRIGISVKSRTRKSGDKGSSVYLFKKDDRKKLMDACKTFACEPWIAIYVETSNFADLYLTSLYNYDNKYRKINKSGIEVWLMNRKEK